LSCTGPTSCSAVGEWSRANGNGNTIAEVWEGVSWTMQAVAQVPGASFEYLASISCTAAAACMAVGSSGPDPYEEDASPLAERYA
jgi:hypothetical protein